MAIVRRVNLIQNPSFEYDLQLWSAFGGASISRVPSGFSTWRMRVTFPTASAGVAGASTVVSGLIPGSTYFLWMEVPNASGATTVQFDAQGIATGSAFATNSPLFKQGALTFTATATTATIRVKSAVASTSGDFVDVDVTIVEQTNPAIIEYATFDGSYPGAYWQGPVGLAPSVFENYNTNLASSPLPVVEFDARPVSSFDFILDRNVLDDSSVALIDSPRWYHVIETERIEVKRGRQDPDSDIGQGSVTITLRDYDAKYDPDNPATPLQINGVPAMRAGMRVRVSILTTAVGTLIAEPLFVGSLEDVQIDRTYEPVTVVSAVDDMAKMNSSDIPPFDPPMRANDQTVWRAAWALSFAGIGFSDFTLGSNMNRLMLATGGGGNVASMLQQVVNCEGGKVYAQRDGRIHVGSHSDDFATSAAAVFTDSPSAVDDIEFSSIVTSTGIRTTINRSIVQRGNYSQPADGEPAPIDAAPAVTAQDDDSVARNNRVWSETIDAPLANNSDAQALASWRATRRSRPMTRVNQLNVLLSSQDPLCILDSVRLDISSVIRVHRYAFGRGIDDQYGVGGIEYSISVDRWDMTIYTEPLDITGLYADQPQPFFLDTSALDGANILSAY
jgi:hypothetical protein